MEAARVKHLVVLDHEQLIYPFQSPVQGTLSEKFQQSKGQSIEHGKDYAAGPGLGCFGEDAVDLSYRIDHRLARNLTRNSALAPTKACTHYLFLK